MAADFKVPNVPVGIPFLKGDQVSQEWILYFQKLNNAVEELQSLL